VAVETILRHIRMLIEERPPLVRMALYTGLLDAVPEQTPVCESAMGIMTVNAEDPAFLERMMTRHRKLGLL